MNQLSDNPKVSKILDKVLIIDKDKQEILRKPSQPFDLSLEKERQEAVEISDRLRKTLQPYLPAAGLAAPQIGIARRLFIFSWDRSEENIAVAMNPSFKRLTDEKEYAWEGCFSAILCRNPTMARVPRYKKIQAFYTNEKFQSVSYILEGFAARLFLHEMDHLDGIVNIFHSEAETKEFETDEQLDEFMKNIRLADRLIYICPQDAPPSIVRQDPVT